MNIGVREQKKDPGIGQFIQLLKGKKVGLESITDDVHIMKRRKGKYILEKWLVT